MLRILGTILLLSLIGFSNAYAYDQIPITLSGKMNDVQLDGKWTFETEWKQSSLNNYSFDNGNTLVVLRSAHQDNYVYILIDAITDEVINKGEDRAAVCFDTNNDKSQSPNDDDYCFDVTLDAGMGHAHQGDPRNTDTNFKEISNPVGFVALAAASNMNDRYSEVPHPAYEFKIPTDLIGRNSIYGFYFEVYDGKTKELYTYPQGQVSVMKNPASWGEIYSPDKSLPEFYLPFLVTIPAFAFIVILNKTKRFL